MSDLETFLTTGVFAFMLAFVRIGTAVMVMPGLGNTFVPQNVRLYFALGFSLVMFPLVQAKLPVQTPGMALMLTLLVSEFILGLFIGLVCRFLMSALDVAGMIVSMQSSLANAQLFNPAFASQGSLIGTFMTLSGMVLLFATDMHHLMLMGIIDSYQSFPVGQIPPVSDMTLMLARTVAAAFAVGIQITAPFIVLIVLMYVGMGVMSKLMPQVQVFMIAVPVQILLALVTLMMVMSGMLLIWLDQYDKGLKFFLMSGG